MTRRIVAANWKMNLPPEGIEGWCRKIGTIEPGEAIEILVAPPFPFFSHVVECLGTSGVITAAQTCSWEESGALTGEVSPGMIRSTGARSVLVGHSERRALFAEDDAVVAKKLAAATSGGLLPVLCIGETGQERKDGRTREVLSRQLASALAAIDPRGSRIVVAYEPVWAIGTGDNATADQAGEAHRFIGEVLESHGWSGVPVLYGGSVKPTNAAELAAADGVAGFLVGGASLDSASFAAIIGAA